MAEIPFADLAEVNPRRRLRRGEPYPFVEMAAVPEGGGRPTHHGEREFNGSGSKFASEDTLFARITPCTENGKLAFVDALPTGTLGFGSTELIVLAAQSGKADPRFIYQFVASEPVRRQAVARMLGTSGRQRVPVWFFSEELTVPNFSLPEQRAIAAVLDSIDEAIERTKEVIAATKRLRDALLHELLTRGLPGHHTAWRDVPGLGTIPACWEVVRLGEVAEVASGQVDPRDEHFQRLLFVAPDDMESGTGRLLARRTVADAHAISGKYEFGELDVLYSKIRPYLAKVCMPGETGLCSADVYPLRAETGLAPTYLALALLSPAFTRYTSTCSDRTGIPKINRPDLLRYTLSLPPLSEQRAIATTLDSVDATIDRSRGERAALQSSKASTADALLAGRVRVGLG